MTGIKIMITILPDSLEKEKTNLMEALVSKGVAICDWLEVKNKLIRKLWYRVLIQLPLVDKSEQS